MDEEVNPGERDVMDHEQTIRNLKRQLLIERIAIGVTALILLTWWSVARFCDGKSLIIVDGKAIVCVSSERDANGILHELKAKTGCDPSEIEFKQDVCVARAPRDATPVSRHKAMRVAARAISPMVQRWAIIVDGKPAVAVPDAETAREVLDLAKLKFGKLAKNLLEEPQFKENVTAGQASVDPSIYRDSAEKAVEFLFTETKAVSRDAVYTVRKGDIAGSIAYRHGIKLDDLWAMNPGTDLNSLQIGDRIRIKKTGPAKAKLTVIVRDLSERTETIPFKVHRVSSAKLYAGKVAEVSPGKSGERTIKVATIYENGRRAGSEILEEQILREPIPRRIAVGIKPRR